MNKELCRECGYTEEQHTDTLKYGSDWRYRCCEKFKRKSGIELKKVHEDERREIYSVERLLQDGKEFTFIILKDKKALGGCIHSTDEYYAVISGKVKVILDGYDFELEAGGSGIFEEGEPHAIVALEDSIIIEWGVDKSKPENNLMDSKMREEVNKINEKTSI